MVPTDNSSTQHLKSTIQLKSERLSTAGDTREVEESHESSRIPAYPYRELPQTEIRLLQILPGKGRIRCLLDQVPESPRPLFCAVSYVWGDGNDKKTILLEGRPFQVTRNLYEALHQFRQDPDTECPGQYFWVDAICMNQNDFDEKSRLVPRMVDIYQTLAVEVYAWLGPNSPPARGTKKPLRQTAASYRGGASTKDLYETIHQKEPSADDVIKEMFEKASSMWLKWDPVDEDDNIVISSVYGSSYPIMLQEFTNLLSRPWFSRIWTIQESCSEANVSLFAGGHKIDMMHFMFFFKILRMQHAPLYLLPGCSRMVALTRLDEIQRYIRFNWDGEDNLRKLEIGEIFYRLLAVTLTNQATDPRDQIYGLIGLLRFIKGEELPTELRPDYTLPCNEVFWNCAAYLFDSTGDLRLLNCDWNGVRNAPSWVPDFRYVHLGPHFRREKTVSVSPDKRTLTVQGISLGTFCDHIAKCALADIQPTRDVIPDGVAGRLEAVEKQILRPSATLRGGDYVKTLDSLIMPINRLLADGGPRSLRQTYRRLRRHVHPKRPRPARRSVTPEVSLMESAIVEEFCHSFLLLTDGALVRVNRLDVDVRPGDLVCIFKGAPKLSVVRPCGEAYTFLSQCEIKCGQFDQEDFGDDFWADKEVKDFKLV
ncbi:HET-domain-containing protein [Xylariaceae sp. FL0662B]|nr:HET-domain-containing protein [Xylariaceae sp. FL0662B]